MIFIYNCYGGTHSSSLASAIHLGDLPLDKVPSRKDILNTAYFDTLSYKDMGKIIYRGTDRWGNKVYTMGRGASKVLIPAFEHLIELLGKECGLDDEIVLVNASPTVSFLMTIGGFLSKALKLRSIGRLFLTIGAQQTYFNIVNLVKTALQDHNLNLSDNCRR